MSEPLPLVEVLLRQRQAWQAGARPHVEDLLQEFPHLAGDANAVLDLIYNETVLREEAGEQNTLQEYLNRFPHLAAELRIQLEVDQALKDELAADPVLGPGPAPGSGQGSTAPLAPLPASAGELPHLPGCDLLDELGRGAMGIVYRGWQRGVQRPVAIKLLSSEMPIERIGNEVAAARLQHPNIVQVFEVGECRGRTALVLEYVEGGNLAQKLNGRPQAPADAARLVETLAWAMAYAHGRGVIHRDLKPSNVLLSGAPDTPLAKCVPRIGDFGLAKLVEGGINLTHTTDILGTPSYMAPEQTGGSCIASGHDASPAHRQITPSADAYALGAILYECLTGRPPFLGQGVLDTLEQVRHQDPVPPSRLQPKIPGDLEIICLRCLHKSPARRYATARALAEDLRRFQANEPILARPVGLLERVWKWSRRRPAAATLLLVSSAALVVFVVGGLSFNQVLRGQRDVALRQADQLDTQLQRTRQLLYTAQLLRVGGVWESDPAQGLRMLEDPRACPVDLRCFTWRVLHAQCTRYRRLLGGHASPVTSLAYSPDGKLLATGSRDGQIKLHLAGSGDEKITLHEHTSAVVGLVFSKDGELLASAGQNGTIHLWTMAGAGLGKLHSSLKAGQRLAGIAFHPDGRTLAVNSGPESGPGHQGRWAVTLWDVRTKRLRRTLRGETSPLSGLAISPDGSTLVCAAPDHSVRLWDPRTGKAGQSLVGNTAPVTCLAFAPAGKPLATGALDARVRLWDLDRAQEADLLEVRSGPITALAFHRGGQTLAVGCTSSGRAEHVQEGPAVGDEAVPDVQLLDVLARQGEEPLRAHPGGVAALAFSPDGQTLATGGADRTVKLWDHPGQRQEVTLRGHTGAPGTIALSRDGRTLAWAGNQLDAAVAQLAVQDPLRGSMRAMLRGHGRPVRCIAVSPDGSRLASAAGSDDEPAELLVWEVGTGRLLQALSGHGAGVTAVAFSPDGRSLASTATDGAVKVWDVESGKARLHLTASVKPALTVGFNGRSLAVGGGAAGQPGAIDVWDTTTRESAHRSRKTLDRVNCLAITADSTRIAYAGKGGLVRLLEVESGEQTELAMGMKGVAWLAFSEDGKTLAVAGTAAGVKVWDVATAQERASLPHHRGGACFVAFSSDGRLLVSASVSQTARLWHAGE